MKNTRYDLLTISTIVVISVLVALSTPVNPWPVDGWFGTQYLLFSQQPGADDYTPIAAPAIFFKLTHWIAAGLGWDLKGEFYVAALGQCVLLALAAYFVYTFFRAAGVARLGMWISFGMLLLVLSTGLPQAFWSENICLFLVAAIIAALGKVWFEPNVSAVAFWTRIASIALSIGLLVLTRVVPVFFIPVICGLFYKRLAPRRVLSFAVAGCVATAVLIVAQMAANDWRFGRFEMTNSTGRHLWQGVRTIADVALANSVDYRATRAKVPPSSQLNWWELSLPDDDSEIALDPVLGRLAKQAIMNRPDLYAKTGLLNFAEGIGIVPYRLGFYAKRTQDDPLKRDIPLPSPAEALIGEQPHLAAAVVTGVRGLYVLGTWLYPALIYSALLTLAVAAIDTFRRAALNRAHPERRRLVNRISVVLFGAAALAGTVDMALFRGSAIETALVCVACLSLSWCAARVAIYRARSDLSLLSVSGHGLADTRAFIVWSLLFFGSLWFSWQVEAANERNVMPYLPVLAILVGAAIFKWGLVESHETATWVQRRLDVRESLT